MSTRDSNAEEGITGEEIAGTAPAPAPTSKGVSIDTKTQRDAFAELMKPKPKASSQTSQELSQQRSQYTKSFRLRDGLGAYTSHPESWPASRVIYYNNDFVAINDLYPKSTVHTLLLPRSPRSRLHPFDAFEDPQFLAFCQAEALKLKKLVGKELQRRYGKFSAADQLREAVLNGDVEWEDEELPKGRDWEREVRVGVHAVPSMNDLHIHVLSPDMYSECMKKRNHYNSFNTPFFVELPDFPLAKDDARRHIEHLDQDFICWRCGKNFGNKFKLLKDHLAMEFEGWKKE